MIFGKSWRWRGYKLYCASQDSRGLPTVGITLTSDRQAPLYFVLELFWWRFVTMVYPEDGDTRGDDES